MEKSFKKRGDCVPENILTPPSPLTPPPKKSILQGLIHTSLESGDPHLHVALYSALNILAFKTPFPSEVPMTIHGVCMDTLSRTHMYTLLF